MLCNLRTEIHIHDICLKALNERGESDGEILSVHVE